MNSGNNRYPRHVIGRVRMSGERAAGKKGGAEGNRSHISDIIERLGAIVDRRVIIEKLLNGIPTT